MTTSTYPLAIVSALRRAKAPERHIQATPRDEGEWAAAARTLFPLLGNGSLVLFCGHRGRGKTQLAVEAMRDAVSWGVSARYTTAIDLFAGIRSSYGGDGPDERTAVSLYVQPQLLVIDDCHERGETEWEDRMLGHIIDRRYGALRDTILISNESKQDSLRRLGRSVSSRMAETGTVIEFTGENFRARREAVA